MRGNYKMMTPHKKLILQSEKYLVLANSKPFLDLQVKFDNKCQILKNELEALSIVISELNTNSHKKIIKKENITIEDNIENDIENLDEVIRTFNKNYITVPNLNFKSL